MSTTQCETVRTPVASFPGERAGFLGSLRRAIVAAVDRLYAWEQRTAQRAQLAATEDYLLKDMGISRVDANREAAKPFWRV